eukprot:6471162-Amphidinium_carterae.1
MSSKSRENRYRKRIQLSIQCRMVCSGMATTFGMFLFLEVLRHHNLCGLPGVPVLWTSNDNVPECCTGALSGCIGAPSSSVGMRLLLLGTQSDLQTSSHAGFACSCWLGAHKIENQLCRESEAGHRNQVNVERTHTFHTEAE